MRDQPIAFVMDEYPPMLGGIATYSRDLVHFACRLRPVELYLWGNDAGPVPESAIPPAAGIQDFRDLPWPQRREEVLHALVSSRATAVVFNHYQKVNLSLALKLRREGKKSYLVVYGADINMVRTPKKYLKLHLLLLYQSRVITISRFTQSVVRRRFPLARTAVVFPGINIAEDTGSCGGRSRRVVSVGRLVARKGFDNLLKAGRLLRDRGVELELGIVGDGPVRRDLEVLAENLGLKEQVHFYGAVDDHAKQRIMHSGRIFCQLPRELRSGDVEGFGIVFLEASAMGLPVVAGASGGVPDAVADGVSGFLVHPGDVQAAADRIQLLLENDSEWERMSKAGRHWALRFVWDRRDPCEELYYFTR